MRAADGGRAWRAWRRGIALGLTAGLASVLLSACGSSSVKPTAATASVVSAPVRVAHTRLGAAANDHVLARLIPGSRLVLYPDAGHVFLFQAGTPFASRVESFLTGHPSS